MDVMTDVDCFKIIQFGVMLLFWSSVHLAQVLWEIAADFWFIMYCFSLFPSLSIFAFYGLYAYGDVWNSIGWSLWILPCIQSMYMTLDEAVYILRLGWGVALVIFQLLIIVSFKKLHHLVFVFVFELGLSNFFLSRQKIDLLGVVLTFSFFCSIVCI